MTSPAPRPDPARDDPEDEGERTYVGRMSFDEYLRYDEASELRHEYVAGAVYAMSGASQNHNTITGNTFARLHTLVRGTGCRAYSQSYKLRTPRGDSYLPDAMVACGPRPPGRSVYLENACPAVEVLSPSTRRTDLGEKLFAYHEVLTLRAYLIVEFEWRCVHRHWRDDAGRWQAEDVTGGGSVPLPCPPGAVLTLAEIYEDVDLPSTPPAPRLRRVREPAPA